MISLIFTSIKHTFATSTTPEIIHQPELIMGIMDREKMPKSYGGPNIFSIEQRIEFIVDFKNLTTYKMYLDSLIEENDIPDSARAYVDLLAYNIKVINGKYYFEKESWFTGVRYMYGKESTNSRFLNLVDVKEKENQVVVSLVSHNIIHGFNLYSYIKDTDNQDKAWQFKLVLKDNSDIKRGYVSYTLLTNVFIIDCSMVPHELVFINEYTGP